MLVRTSLAISALLLVVQPVAAGTILTFDVTGIQNFQDINQAYGDRVAAAADGAGTYGTDDGTYTSNVVVEYGAPDEDPALWTTGYGDLSAVYFNDADGDTTLTARFTADAGYVVDLVRFDIASYASAGRTIQGAQAIDAATNLVLWSIGSTLITGATHLTLAPAVSARDIRIVIDLTGLGTFADDVGLDNVLFAQRVATTPVPEPSVLSMLMLGLPAWVAGRKLRRPGCCMRRCAEH